jgi:hypothetical protein
VSAWAWAPPAAVWAGLILQWVFFFAFERPHRRRYLGELDALTKRNEEMRTWAAAQNERAVKKLQTSLREAGLLP